MLTYFDSKLDSHCKFERLIGGFVKFYLFIYLCIKSDALELGIKFWVSFQGRGGSTSTLDPWTESRDFILGSPAFFLYKYSFYESIDIRMVLSHHNTIFKNSILHFKLVKNQDEHQFSQIEQNRLK